MPPSLAVAAVVLAAAPALAQTAPQHPVRIPAPGGEVIIANARQQSAYDAYRFAPARRVGDMLYVSGVIIGRGPDEGTDSAAFKIQARRAFKGIEGSLKAAGVGWDDVAMMNSFHVWTGPNFTGEPTDQINVMNEVRAEFTQAPNPAWTAVGTTGLMAANGIVELQVIAYAPLKK